MGAPSKYHFDKMEIGDVISIPLDGTTPVVNIRVAANCFGQFHGRKFLTRQRPKKQPTRLLIKRIS